MKALKDMAARLVRGVEYVPKEIPVGPHAKNGEMEWAVHELRRQLHAIRLSLEIRLGRKLESKDPVLTWMPAFVADVMARHRRGTDWSTAWVRETCRERARGAFQFGEKLMMREARDRTSSVKRDWGRDKLRFATWVIMHVPG